MTRLPAPDNRTAIIGSTGSGKTFLAAWLLGTRDFHLRPWVIFDFKGDKLIRDLKATEINVFGPPPKRPGLYVVRPIPDAHDEAVELFLWRCWQQENIGLYFDEGYMIPARSVALKALLTQGRSKRIEMITLIQRPVWCSKFIFSEASFIGVMRVTTEDDRKTVKGYLDIDRVNRLPKYHSLWYDVDEQAGTVFKPVPGRAALIEAINSRLENRRKAI